MKINGSCHCGKITYRAEIDPDKIYVCHCTDCQAISGSPFRWGVTVLEEDYQLLSGEPKKYKKVTDSGDENYQVFCPDCASPLYSVSLVEGPRQLNIRLGTAEQRNQLAPRIQVWHRSAQSWLDNLSRVDALETQ